MLSRKKAITQIVCRVKETTNLLVGERECIQIATAAFLIQDNDICNDVVRCMFNRKHMYTSILKNSEQIQMTFEEFACLFGDKAYKVETPSAAKVIEMARNVTLGADGRQADLVELLQAKMRLSLSDQQLHAKWEKMSYKTAAILSLYTNEHERTLEAAMGAVMSSDMRRIGDIRELIETGDTDATFLCAIVDAALDGACI